MAESDSDSAGVEDTEDDERGSPVGADGLTSERIEVGEMGSSIGVDRADCRDGSCRGDFAVLEVARDIRRTSNGRICFPSDVV